MLDLNKTGKTNSGIFGLDYTFDDSEVVFIPGSWDACSSFKKGSCTSAEKIKQYSPQCDLFHRDFPDFVYSGLHMLDTSKQLIELNKKASVLADSIISIHETSDEQISENLAAKLNDMTLKFNTYSKECNDSLYNVAEKCINANKLIGLIGGNHSCSFPIINALIDYVDSFCILQIDAHMDLRSEYQGFTYSHASVMNNCIELDDISRLIQVGVRDFCEEEYFKMKDSKGKIKTYFDQDIKYALFNGKTWDSICKKIINNCTQKVYVSIDMDGLTAQYCPNTGTLVPGGLTYDHIIYLIKLLSESKKTIIGFDIVEANGGFDSADIITATKLLYNLAGYSWITHK